MWFFSALGSAIIFGLSGFMMKYGSERGSSPAALLCGLYLTGTAGFLILALLQNGLMYSSALVIGGLLVGIGSTWGNYFFMRGLAYGPASLTALIVNANVILIVLMSIFYYGESITLQEIIGISLLLFCIGLLPIDPEESISIHNKIWYFFVTLAVILFFFRNGGLKVTEELGLDNTLILFYGYLFGLLWSCGQLFWERSKHLHLNTVRGREHHSWLAGLLAGIFSFGGMQLYAYALSIGPASLVSPIFSTYGLVVALLSMWWFAERLSLLQWISMVGILGGIILLRL